MTLKMKTEASEHSISIGGDGDSAWPAVAADPILPHTIGWAARPSRSRPAGGADHWLVVRASGASSSTVSGVRHRFGASARIRGWCC